MLYEGCLLYDLKLDWVVVHKLNITYYDIFMHCISVIFIKLCFNYAGYT